MGAVVWLSRLIFSSVAPAVKDEFNLTYAEVGLPPMAALAFAAAGYAVSGFLVYKLGTRKVLLIASVAMLTGTLGTANSASFRAVFLFQGMAGLSEGLFYVAALVTLTDTFNSSKIGRAIGVLESAINIGILAALTTGAVITAILGWRVAYYLVSGLAFLTLVLIGFLSEKSGKKYQETKLGKIVTDRYTATLFVPTIIFFLSFWSFWAFVPTYLRDVQHVPLAISGAISSAPFLLAIFASFAGGVLADRLGPKKAALAATTVYAVFLVLFALTSNLVVVTLSLFLIAFSQTFLAPVIFAFIPKRFPEFELGRTYGIITSIAYAAGAVGPIFVGWVADAYGFVLAFLIMAMGIASSGIVILRKL